MITKVSINIIDRKRIDKEDLFMKKIKVYGSSF